jgi:hypothetical protein
MRLKTLLPLLFFGFSATAQVTLQTGAPSINIPLIQYADETSKLKLDISLSYTGGNGIKVDDKASEVGLGWSLNAGGMVQRIKVGEPDDQIHIEIPRMNSNNKPNPIHIPAGIFNQPINQNPVKLAWNPSYDKNDGDRTYYDPLVHFDREHDKFIFSMNGESGSFILGKTYPHNALQEELSGNKITVLNETPSGSNAGSIKGIMIKNENGLVYTYDNKLLSAIMNYQKAFSTKYRLEGSYYWLPTYEPGLTLRNQYTTTGFHYNEAHQFVVFVPYLTPYRIANAWYLSKIENPNTGDKITFNYYTKEYTENGGVFGAKSVTAIDVGGHGGNDYINSLALSENYIDEIYPILSSVDLPNGKKIVFNYLNKRKDQIGKTSLDEILYYNSNQLQYKYSLKYGYFFESSIADATSLPSSVMKNDIALALTSITKFAADGSNEPATNFDYYTGINGSTTLKFPKRDSYSQDHWGFYNAKNINKVSVRVNSTSDVISFSDFENYIDNKNITRSPEGDNNIVQIGMLKSISNKYGGKTVYNYSTNKAMDGDVEVLSGGVRVSKITNYKNLTDYSEKQYDYRRASGNTSADYYDKPNYELLTEAMTIVPNCDRYKRYTGSAFNNVTVAQSVILKTEGLINKVNNVGKLTKLFGGTSHVLPFFSNLNYLISFFQYLKLTGLFTTSAYSEGYAKIFSNSTLPINANNYVQPNYSLVTEYDYGNDANNNVVYGGYTKYEFVSAIDKPIGFHSPTSNYGFPFSNKQKKLSFLYNMPKSQRKYDSNSRLLNEKIFIYNDYYINNTTSEYFSLKNGPKWMLTSPDDPQGNSLCGSQTFGNYGGLYTTSERFIQDYYHFYSGKSYLTQTTERQYNNNNFLETKTDYTYVPNSHLQRSVKTTDSKGDITESKVFYSSDYNTPVETDLASKNIITPIATELWKMRPSWFKPKLLSTSVTEYGTVPNGDLKPIKSYSLKADEPVDIGVIGDFNPNLLVRDDNLITLNGEISYDDKGNKIQETTAPNNTVNSVMYNNENVPIATVTNANRTDIAYTSFENVAVSDGGFVIVQDDSPLTDDNYIPFYATGLCPTGNRCVELSRPLDKIYSTINIDKESVLSFWTTNVVSINHFINIPSLVGPTINGWTYYEYNVPAGTASVNITGKAKIDEVRLYPKNAKMITTTYDLANNKTSECDINNRITYFESDKLGRPTKVMDEKRNIIKTFEYHFKNQ